MLPNNFQAQVAQDKAIAQAKATAEANQQEAALKAKQEEFEASLVANGGVVLTDEILKGNEPLRRKGLIAGDYLIPSSEEEGTYDFHRMYSKEPKGDVITEEVLKANPQLVEAGLEVGDQLQEQEDGTYKPFYAGHNKSMQNFAYFATKTPWISNRLGEYMLAEYPEFAGAVQEAAVQSQSPLAALLNIPQREQIEAGMLGEDFMQITPEERRERIAEYKIAQLQQRFPDLVPDEDTVSATAGGIAGAVADPALMAAKFGKASEIVMSSLGIGVAEAGSKQLAETGKIDMNKLLEESLTTATAVAAGGFAIPAAVKGAVTVPLKTVAALPKLPTKVAEGVSAQLKKTSRLRAKEMQQRIDMKIQTGRSPEEAFTAVVDEMGLSKDKAIEYIMRAEADLPIPPTRTEKAIETFNSHLENYSDWARNFSTATDNLLGLVSTRIKQKSPRLHGMLLQFERRNMTQIQESFNRIRPYAEEIGKLSKEQQEEFQYLLHSNPTRAKEYLFGAGLNGNVMEIVRTEMDSLYGLMRKNGFQVNKQDDYFPRVVKDYEGLVKAIGGDTKNRLEAAFEKYAQITGRIDKETKKADVTLLKPEEKAQIADLVISGHDLRVINSQGMQKLATMWKLSDNGIKFGFVRPRQYKQIPRELMKYYENPLTAVEKYVSGTINKINKRRLFNFKQQDFTEKDTKSLKLLTRKEPEQAARLPMEDDVSVGSFVTQLMDNGVIKGDDVDEIVDLINARFGKGEEAAPAGARVLRDLGYLGTIANIVSAFTNLTDIGYALYSTGIKNTIKTVFNEKNIKALDIGIEKAAAEFQDTSKMANTIGRLFKASGFQLTDRLGKETIINAAFRKYSNMARAGKTSEIIKKWGNAFGEADTQRLINDLAAGRVTDLTKDFVFMELSRFQPVSRLEATAFYMNNPNWRIAYMLKSFMLKQWDLVRNDVVNQIKAGNKVEGYKNLALLGLYLGASNTSTSLVKDFIRGREIRPEDIPNKFMWQTLGVFGFDKYSSSKYLSQGDFTGWLQNQIMPAVPLFEAGIEGGRMVFADDEDEAKYNKLIRPIPIFGDLIYHWFLGGAEKYNERQEQEREKKRQEAIWGE